MTKTQHAHRARISSFGAVAVGAGVLVVGAAGNIALGQTAEAATDGTVVVTDVVDGDTIKVDIGGVTEAVRLVGIDTPEVGQCGYQEASDALAALLAGGNVTLTVGAQDDRDRYDRLLRYVNITEDGGALADIGLAMIDRSWAIARYDSRDGYGSHPLEGRYVAADEATPSGNLFVEACDPGEELPEFVTAVNDTEPQPQPQPQPEPESAPAPAPPPPPQRRHRHRSRTTIRGTTAVPATRTAPAHQVVARCRTTRTQTSTTTRTTTAAPATPTAPARQVAAGEPPCVNRGRCRLACGLAGAGVVALSDDDTTHTIRIEGPGSELLTELIDGSRPHRTFIGRKRSGRRAARRAVGRAQLRRARSTGHALASRWTASRTKATSCCSRLTPTPLRSCAVPLGLERVYEGRHDPDDTTPQAMPRR